MKILFAGFRAENQTAQHRIVPVARELRERGHECDVTFGTRREVFGHTQQNVSLSSLSKLLTTRDYDSIVISRDAGPIARTVLTLARALDVPVVYDVDDPVFQNTTIGDSWLPNPVYYFVDSMISESDAVLTSNEYIHQYATERNERARMLPTPVDPSVFTPSRDPPREYDETVVGWMGTGPAHEDNLPLLVDPLLDIGRSFDVRLRIVSALDSAGIRQACSPLEAVIPVDYGFDEWVPIERIADEMATFDLAALPLDAEDEFMKGKSVVKVAEHQAMEIPVVASNFGAFGRAIRDGETGLLCENVDEWKTNIRYLLQHPDERAEMAERGRELVEAEYSVDTFVDELEDVLRMLTD
jgi:glycosyltransferase involved in cell wall biosynthesis